MIRRAGLVFVILLMTGLAQAKTDFGIDVLKKENYFPLKGASVALITNHTCVDKYGNSTVDLLRHAQGVRLVCILTPEHGFRGEVKHGESIQDAIDEQTGLPVYSLYGQTSRPTPEMLKGVNTIVFDIQDVGTRFYTYAATMAMALEEAAKKKIRFFVLDRPNPIRGDIFEGDVLDADIKRLTGYFQIPVRHGLTLGELAMWMNQTQKLNVHLEVIKMKGWKRHDWYEKTGHDFLPPSPNIRSLQAALLYPGVGCFEATNVSVGRGTETPFEVFGAPWLDAKSLLAQLRQFNFPGVVFSETSFTPSADLYQGEECHGVKLIVTDRNLIRSFDIFVATFLYLYSSQPEFKPIWEEIRVVTGSRHLEEIAEKGGSLEEVRSDLKSRLDRFQLEMAPFFLY